MTAVSRLLSRDLVLSGAPVPFCLRLWRGGTWQRLPHEANGQVTGRQCSGSLLAARACSSTAPGTQVHRPLGTVAGRRLDRHREGAATYRDGLDGHGPAGPAASTRPPGPRTARRRRGGPPARCPGQRPGTVSRISRPFSRIREPAAMPHRQLIRTPIRVPADSGAPFKGPSNWAGVGMRLAYRA
jgi:hypothetical protein